MPHTAQDFFRQIDDEFASAGGLIETIRQSNRAAAHRINALFEKRTDAFVRLAKHYLPVLTLKTLADAWHEVHGEIRQIMLAQSDTCRQLQRELALQDARCHEIETELHETTERFEKARRDLLSKTGSFHKHLREDPEIARLSAEITRVDREIQIGIDSLEAVNDEAQKKLPDYEECELFRYLRKQKYGTAEYRQSGLERRWDRWIARLINFDEANESFEYLTETPLAIQELILEKQDRYKQLLRALESARTAAADRYGVEEQTRLRDQLGDEAESLEQQHTEAMWDRSILESDLQEAEDINGEHYQKALAIYTEFLKLTQPETLAVYAACTESPVDDEICARIRSLQSEIENEQAESVAHADRIVELRKYRTGLNELSRLLRNHLRHSSSEVRTRDDFRFDIVLNDMRDLHLSPMKTWRRLLAAISDPIRTVPLAGRFAAKHPSPHAGELGPVEAAFLAAAENSLDVLGGRPCDPTGVLIRPEREPSESGRQAMFDTLAICRSESESKHIVSLLQEHGIRCFAHDHLLDLPAEPGGATAEAWETRGHESGRWEDHAQQRLAGVAVEHAADCSQAVPQINAVDFSSVVVEVAKFHEARHHLLSHLRRHDTEWDCPACGSRVDRGYHHCWRCGQTAPHS